MKNKDLPPICGFEFEINKLVNKEKDSRQFPEKSNFENDYLKRLQSLN